MILAGVAATSRNALRVALDRHRGYACHACCLGVVAVDAVDAVVRTRGMLARTSISISGRTRPGVVHTIQGVPGSRPNPVSDLRPYDAKSDS